MIIKWYEGRIRLSLYAFEKKNTTVVQWLYTQTRLWINKSTVNINYEKQNLISKALISANHIQW